MINIDEDDRELLLSEDLSLKIGHLLQHDLFPSNLSENLDGRAKMRLA